MKTYSEFQPTGFDPKGLGCEDQQDWLVAPCARNRDSGVLDSANWESQLEILNKADPTGEDFEVNRFGHWACGWFEIILVRPGTKAAEEMDSCEAALSDYPVLDDSKYFAMEHEEKQLLWKQARLKERIELCNKAGINIMAARRDDMPQDVDQHIEVQ